jgi:hypothetical protein
MYLGIGVPLLCLLYSVILLFVGQATAVETASTPNSDATYRQLRNVGLGAEAVPVNDFILRRDAGTFHLHSGTFCFLAPVQGKVTGAVFTGDGVFILDPPLASETRSLKLLTKEDEFSERFNTLVLRFTDSTYEEIKGTGKSSNVSVIPVRCRIVRTLSATNCVTT